MLFKLPIITALVFIRQIRAPYRQMYLPVEATTYYMLHYA